MAAGPISPGTGLRREVLADSVYEAIKALIMDQQIAPGMKINMDALARELEVSPTPVREALARLESDGLVTKKALLGYTAAALLDARGLDELFEMRLLLEPAAARWAAQSIEKADVAALGRMVTDVRGVTRDSRGDDYRAYRAVVLHDREFHEAIADASGRTLLLQTLRRLHPHTQLYRLFFRHDHGRATLAEHTEIVRTLRQRDPEAAAAAMTRHLERAYARFHVAVEEAAGSAG
jgi:DNA-binding GntR family transcriptional regulator